VVEAPDIERVRELDRVPRAVDVGDPVRLVMSYTAARWKK